MIGALILVALIRLLNITHSVGMCAGIYTALHFLTGLTFGEPFPALLLSTAIHFALSWVFFSLLEYYSDNLRMWWLTFFVFVMGPPLFLMLTL